MWKSYQLMDIGTTVSPEPLRKEPREPAYCNVAANQRRRLVNSRFSIGLTDLDRRGIKIGRGDKLPPRMFWFCEETRLGAESNISRALVNRILYIIISNKNNKNMYQHDCVQHLNQMIEWKTIDSFCPSPLHEPAQRRKIDLIINVNALNYNVSLKRRAFKK